MATLTVRTVDAETDKPVAAFNIDGKLVNVSLIVLPVSIPAASASTAQSMVEILAADANNAPLGPADASDKQATLSAGFSPYGGYLAGVARIYRIPGEGLSIDLGVVSGDLAGWWCGVIPAENTVYDFMPLLFFVNADTDQSIYGFKKDLSALAREVLEKRAKAKTELAKLAPEWGGSLTAVPWPVLQMVHNYVENALGAQDQGLAAYWINDLSWAVMDFAIPAREFGLLVERYARIRAILGEVPYPDIPHFGGCAEGLPFAVGKDGDVYSVTNWRLCVPSFSAYFDGKTDNEIRTDLGGIWLAGENFALIVECIVKHIQSAEESLKRKIRIMKVVSYLAPILILPSPATIISTISDVAGQTFLKNAKWYVSLAFDLAKGLVMSLLGVPGAGVEGGWETDAVKGAFDKALDFAKQVSLAGLSIDAKKLAKDASILAELNDELKASAVLNAAAEILGSMSEDQVAALFKAVQNGASYADFVQMILESKNLPPILIPWLSWCIGVTGMGVLLAQLFDLAREIGGLLGSAWGSLPTTDPQADVTLPLVGIAADAGVTVPQGTVAILNGSEEAYPQQPMNTVSGAKAAASVTGTLALIATLTYSVVKGIIR